MSTLLRPKYNEWTLVRQITVAGFATDADWVATQGVQLLDGAGAAVAAFAVPNLPGRTANGFAVMGVAVDAAGAPVAPAAGTISVSPIEIVSYAGAFDDQARHIAKVESLTTPLAALAYTLPLNVAARIPGVGGAQNAFALRVTGISAPAGAIALRLLIKPLG